MQIISTVLLLGFVFPIWVPRQDILVSSMRIGNLLSVDQEAHRCSSLRSELTKFSQIHPHGLNGS